MNVAELTNSSVDPRRWFVERIRAQAQVEGVAFTPFEQEYLFLTEQGNDEAAVKMLDAIKGRDFEHFDSRINGLAWRRYQADLASDLTARDAYKAQLSRLANIDEWPNLSTFITPISLDTPPEELNAKSSWRPLAVVAIVVLALIALRFWHR